MWVVLNVLSGTDASKAEDHHWKTSSDLEGRLPSSSQKMSTKFENLSEDQRRWINDFSSTVGVCNLRVTILTSGFTMKRVATKFVPRLLAQKQRENRVEVCQELSQCRRGPFPGVIHVTNLELS